MTEGWWCVVFVEDPKLVDQAREAAEAAGDRARVRVSGVSEMADLKGPSDLLELVWGRNDDGVPVPTEMQRSLVHAGGLISAAYDATSGELLGTAVLGRGEPGECYSYIAAARPGAGDRGIGFALKQQQRAWALANDLTTMLWTFDPLVSRNARFNLTKLGARVHEYEPGFYGQMSDDINGDDVADRLAVRWRMDAPAAVEASELTLRETGDPDLTTLRVLADGPDGRPAYAEGEGERWCRVAADIVALRRTDHAQASAWRSNVRDWLMDSFASGFVADGASRTSWYHLGRDST